jgi:hypothetical protein
MGETFAGRDIVSKLRPVARQQSDAVAVIEFDVNHTGVTHCCFGQRRKPRAAEHHRQNIGRVANIECEKIVNRVRVGIRQRPCNAGVLSLGRLDQGLRRAVLFGAHHHEPDNDKHRRCNQREGKRDTEPAKPRVPDETERRKL